KFHDASRLSQVRFVPEEVFEQIRLRVVQGTSCLIAGATGAGKTTFLSLLLNAVPAEERVICIEESLEIPSSHPHLVRLVARPSGPEGGGEIPLRQLVRNALRMRPDRIVVGECRGEEAWDLVHAMTTG